MRVLVLIPALLNKTSILPLPIRDVISAAAERTDFWDARSRSTVLTGMEGYLELIVWTMASSLDCVREARMSRAGDCEDRERAMA